MRASMSKSWSATARRLSALLFPQEPSIRNLLNRNTTKHGIILEVLLDKTVVRGPTHLGRFRRILQSSRFGEHSFAFNLALPMWARSIGVPN